MSNNQRNVIINEKTNTSVIRLIALQVVSVTALFLITRNPVFTWILFADFFVRGVLQKSNGLFFFIASQIENNLLRSGKAIDKAPKLFAAFIGFVFSFIIVVSYILNFHVVSVVLSSMLIFFALLEGVFDYCVACQFYSLYVRYRNWRRF